MNLGVGLQPDRMAILPADVRPLPPFRLFEGWWHWGRRVETTSEGNVTLWTQRRGELYAVGTGPVETRPLLGAMGVMPDGVDDVLVVDNSVGQMAFGSDWTWYLRFHGIDDKPNSPVFCCGDSAGSPAYLLMNNLTPGNLALFDGTGWRTLGPVQTLVAISCIEGVAKVYVGGVEVSSVNLSALVGTEPFRFFRQGADMVTNFGACVLKDFAYAKTGHSPEDVARVMTYLSLQP